MNNCKTCRHNNGRQVVDKNEDPLCYSCLIADEAFQKYEAASTITNADRIRSMSDEELAVWIAENCGCGDWCMHERSGACENSPKDAGHCCIDVWVDWLSAPAESSIFESMKRGLEQAINGETRSETLTKDGDT